MSDIVAELQAAAEELRERAQRAWDLTKCGSEFASLATLIDGMLALRARALESVEVAPRENREVDQASINAWNAAVILLAAHVRTVLGSVSDD